jgi:TonB family protein
VPGDVLPGAPRDDAQPAVPTISGTVFDPSGARVPNAIVSVKQKVIGPEQTSSVEFAETTVADDVGEFSFKGVAPGHYQLEVSKPGFAVFRQQLEIKPGSAVYQGKVIHPGPLEILIELTPGEVLENVEVTALAPPDSAAKSPSSAPRRIRVGGLVQRTKLVEQTKPEYPESARAKGIQGVVLLQAVISKEGQPYSLNVLNSPDPALSEAARRAVEQWRYEPTLLNGEPIEVATTIAVRFHLEP